MFDWIFLSGMINSFVTPIGAVVFISIVVFCFGSIVTFGHDKDHNFWNDKVSKMTIKIIIGTSIISLFRTIGDLPNIVIKANIDRVKIYYTSPESIKEIEKGAKEVVNKLDKLIDKGIESINKEKK